jgi:hypothetical protein
LLAWYHAEDFTYNAETVENPTAPMNIFLMVDTFFGRAEFPPVYAGETGKVDILARQGLSIVRRRRHLRERKDGPGFRNA